MYIIKVRYTDTSYAFLDRSGRLTKSRDEAYRFRCEDDANVSANMLELYYNETVMTTVIRA